MAHGPSGPDASGDPLDPGAADPTAVVSAARRGEQDAWRELYSRHARRLTIWLHSVPLPDAAASPDDIASEAWLTAAAKIGTFTGDDDEFAPWLFTIARNHASNTRRTALRRRTDPVAVGHDDSAPLFATGDAVDPGDAVAQVDAQDRTRRLLARLSPREAEVVACIDVVGLDVAATAQALGMRPTAVRVARHRALGRLRTLVGHDPHDTTDETPDESSS
ncbi:RNA polymerase sigma factor [Nocardioides flavescens]|uniref:Sigma-70 family RNA polymerase sigma factor n=1 Tax=Nocardioides flavescens TaxID=2691959 RepID=A0A6L7F232_9ACTN|nr:sigma-70 family RNA polymerase sigma factor [Nocardioides flavescens]MXG91131.1 sigma-70 family RNA polymerase sigma factor [Nocardioides flavescens]